MPACYTLELQDGCYYVGLTDNWQSLGTRMSYHFSCRGSSWSKLHAPIRLLQAVEGNKATEQQRTIALMKEKGWTVDEGQGGELYTSAHAAAKVVASRRAR